MTRNGGSCLLLGIMENGMARSFAKEFAALLDKVPQKLAMLHALALDPHRNGFASRVRSTGSGQLTVSLKNQTKGFPQVAPGFGQRPALGVHTRDFLDIGDVPTPALLDYRRKFLLHTNTLPQF